MNMKHTPSTSIRAYQTGYVVVLILVFLFVTFMSAKSDGETFEDNFYKKNLLIQNFNRLRIKLGDHVFNDMLVGKQGWMEYTGGKNLDDYQNVANFSPEALQTTAQLMRDCHRYAEEHDFTFLVVVAPNKASIYPDKLPEEIQPLSDLTRLDQLNNYLRSQNIPEALDLRPALRAARQEQDLYYKMGTHWNEYGAYVAYETIINALSPEQPDLAPYSAKFLRFRRNPKKLISRGDMAVAGFIQANHLELEPTLFSTRNIEDVYYQIDFALPLTVHSYHRVTWIPESGLPSLVIYHDSFGDAGLNKFLALNFRRGYYIHLDSSPLFLNRQALEQFSPDVVIFQVVERNLRTLQYHLRGCAER
jgi:alginate O-acetyltransferase complex protein AlgJ